MKTSVLLQWIAGAGIALAGCSRAPTGPPIVAVPPPVVTVAPPAWRTIARTLELPGNVVAGQQAMIYARVPGYLRALRVDKGDTVAAGQLLAVITSPELEREAQQARAAAAKARSDAETAGVQVLSARADLVSARADYRQTLEQVRQAREDVAARTAEAALSRATYRRLQRIHNDDAGLIPRQDLDTAEMQLTVARSRLAQAKEAVRAAQLAAEAARARRDAARRRVQAARTRQDSAAHERRFYQEGAEKAARMQAYTEIRAPFAGTVTERFLDPGVLVQSSADSAQRVTRPLLALAAYETVRIQVQVPEPDAPFVHPDTPVTVTAYALPRRLFHGRIRRVAHALDTATRTMLAEAELANPRGRLLPGMLATVRLDLETLPHRLTVPTGAVLFSKDRRFVFLYRDGHVKRQAVATGVVGPTWVEITGGLRPTDRVVVAGREGLSDGDAVTLAPHRMPPRSRGNSARGGDA